MSPVRLHLTCAAVCIGLWGCGDVRGAPYTSLGINVHLPSETPLDQLWISGVMLGGDRAFAPALAPEQPRLLVGSRESLVILLDDQLDGTAVRVRVDGMWRGEVVGSGADDVLVSLGALVGAHIRLREPAICGDGIVAPGLEACDDGNARAGDGCDPSCGLEPDYACVIAPPEGPSTCAPLRLEE